MVALEGGRLLVHGGLDATERRLDDAWMFDTVTYENTLQSDWDHALCCCCCISG